MKNTTYLREKEALLTNLHYLEIETSPTWQRRYIRFATNLRRALPTRTDGQLQEQFRRAVLNRQLSFLVERFSLAVPCGWNDGGSIVADLRRRPAVVGTFHSGSYRLLVHHLLRHHLPVALLVSRAVRQKQEDGYREALAAADLPQGALTIIEAEHPAAGIQLIRALRQGRSVVGYLDGNLGSGVQPHLLTVPFLATRIRVRVGLAWLAVRAGVPFIGVLCRRTSRGAAAWEARYLTDGSISSVPRAMAEDATAQLYSWLADRVAAEPWQWDNWFYVHENFCDIQEN